MSALAQHIAVMPSSNAVKVNVSKKSLGESFGLIKPLTIGVALRAVKPAKVVIFISDISIIMPSRSALLAGIGRDYFSPAISDQYCASSILVSPPRPVAK